MLHFGAFDLDIDSGDLWKSGVRVKLQPQPMKILCFLAARAGRLVSREQIQKHIWSQETFVDFEHGLNYSIRSIRSALGDDAEAPRFIETEPRRGYRFIADVTNSHAEVEPENLLVASSTANGYSVPSPLPPGLVQESASQGGVAPSDARHRRIWAVLVASVILSYPVYRIASHAFTSTKPTLSPVSVEVPTSRRSIAVLGFKNLSGRPEEAWLSTALSEMLSTELAAGKTLRIVPEENIARMKIDLALGDVDSYAPETLAKISKYSGTAMIVSGSYLGIRDKGTRHLRVDFRLQDTATGETIESDSQIGTQEALFSLISQAGAQLRSKLGARELSAAEASGVQSALPNSSQAAQFYSQGLDKMRAFNAMAAKDLLEKAVAAEPEFSLAHTALASSWSALGYDARARREAEIAFKCSKGLSREDHLFVEGQYREAIHEWPRAIQIYQTLATFYPDNLDYGLRLAGTQIASGDEPGALLTAAALRKLPLPIADDPRIDYLEMKAYGAVGDYIKEDAAGVRALQNAKNHGAMLLVAETLRLACWSSMETGHPDKAIAECKEAMEISSRAGDKVGAAASLGNEASVLDSQGKSAAALKKYEQSIAVFREVGDQRRIATVLINMGNIVPLGERRQKMYEEALAIYRTIDDKHGQSMGLGNLGNTFIAEGDLAHAHERYQEALTLARGIDDKNLTALWLSNEAEILADLGDLNGANRLVTQALEIDRSAGNTFQVSDDLLAMGNILRQQGKSAEARLAYSEAVEIRKGSGDATMVAEAQLALVELSLDDGDSKAAVALLREASPALHQANLADDEVLTKALLSDALLSQGDWAAAETEIKSGLLLRGPYKKHGNQVHDVNVRFDIAENRLLALTKPAEATASLKHLLTDAVRTQYLNQQFEIRLAAAQIELTSSDKTAARSHLAQLAKDARTKGFMLIADKATHASSGQV